MKLVKTFRLTFRRTFGPSTKAHNVRTARNREKYNRKRRFPNVASIFLFKSVCKSDILVCTRILVIGENVTLKVINVVVKLRVKPEELLKSRVSYIYKYIHNVGQTRSVKMKNKNKIKPIQTPVPPQRQGNAQTFQPHNAFVELYLIFSTIERSNSFFSYTEQLHNDTLRII